MLTQFTNFHLKSNQKFKSVAAICTSDTRLRVYKKVPPSSRQSLGLINVNVSPDICRNIGDRIDYPKYSSTEVLTLLPLASTSARNVYH